jgi:hypothetical protein
MQLYMRVERRGCLLVRLLLGRWDYVPVPESQFMDTTPFPALTDEIDYEAHTREHLILDRRNPYTQVGMPRNLTGRDRRRNPGDIP